jgi:hypothetical protein
MGCWTQSDSSEMDGFLVSTLNRHQDPIRIDPASMRDMKSHVASLLGNSMMDDMRTTSVYAMQQDAHLPCTVRFAG